MPNLIEIGQWITENEALLSGLAALVVIAGVILSPVGIGIRRLFTRTRRLPGAAAVAGAPPAPIRST